MRFSTCLLLVLALAPFARAKESLNLTEVLESRGPAQARAEALVHLKGWDRPSYSGFFATEAGKMMFMWYFPAQRPRKETPVVVWLQGGPGGSSMFGLFAEMGPISVDAAGDLHARETSWNVDYDMIFIDNPVGAGFSYAESDGDYCDDTRECVARNLCELLEQFYAIFTEKRNSPLYLTGESYAGHYVPATAAYIVLHEKMLPLAGIAVGDGWVDPVNMIPGYPELVYALGLADNKERRRVQKYCDKTVERIEARDYLGAFELWDEMLNGDVYEFPNYFHNISGSNDYDNFANTNAPPEFDYYERYLQRPGVREALHVGDEVKYSQNASDCERHLLKDFHVSYRPELETVLNASLKVLVYSGQNDVIIGTALTERFLPFVRFPLAVDFAEADRAVWRVSPSDSEVAGFATQVGNFSRVVIRGAGHIVPADKPRRALDMIRRFIENTPYQNQPDPIRPPSDYSSIMG